jgi:hypothetical protein
MPVGVLSVRSRRSSCTTSRSEKNSRNTLSLRRSDSIHAHSSNLFDGIVMKKNVRS